MKGTTSSAIDVMRRCPPTITNATNAAINAPTTYGLTLKADVMANEMELACTMLPTKLRAQINATEKSRPTPCS